VNPPPRLDAWRLVFRSLRFYARTHFQVFLGTVFAASVLIGALAVGDSVKHSLRIQAENRLGRIDFAWTAGERFFRQSLAREIRLEDQRSRTQGQRPNADPTIQIAPVILIPGTAIAQGGQARANHVQIIGIDRDFSALARKAPPNLDLAPEEAAINRRLAAQLGVKPGDDLLLRVRLPSAMPSDAPLATIDQSAVALRVRVKRQLDPDELGDFALEANPSPPHNLFLPLAWLSEQLKLTNRANVMLAAVPRDASANDALLSVATNLPAKLNSALKRAWRLSDAGLELRALTNSGGWELRSERVFLEPEIETALAQFLRPETGQAEAVFSYFVNELKCGDRATPYSVVTALGHGVGMPLANDEMIINQWLADDLRAEAGSQVELTYYVLGPMRSLQELTSVFRVRAIIPMTHPAATPDLMPDFPGLADAGSCRDWDPGIPIDLKRIRPQDEAYWERYRGTPKAFITMPAAQRLWANRYGQITALRFPGKPAIDLPPPKDGSKASTNRVELESPWERILSEKITPQVMGVQLLPIGQTGIAASRSSVDFGQLFLGLSFFLIIAALVLTTLLFVFGIEQRSEEIGTLKSLGFRPKDIRALWLREAGLVVFTGAGVGLLAGIAYARFLLQGLGSIWRGAVGGTGIEFNLSPATAGSGMAATVMLVFATLTFALHRVLRRSATELQRHTPAPQRTIRPLVIRWLLAALLSAAGLSAVLWGKPERGMAAAGLFFGAGAALLLGTLTLVDAVWLRLETQAARHQVRWWRVAAQNCVRRRVRSLAAAGVLACGIFLVLSVAANRHDPTADAGQRRSGTGGFALYGESALPILMDLNTADGRKQYALDEPKFNVVRFVSCRVRQGDDASCLNLNRAQQPRLLGVDIQELAGRQAFRFARLDSRIDPAQPWSALNLDLGPNEIPAVVDDTVLTWGLGKGLGDTLDYTDEHGQEFKLRFVGTLANSILQGSVLISQKAFIAKYPSISGARVFLVDVPPNDIDNLRNQLVFVLQDWGVELTPAANRLAEFSQVELTYLSIFGLLGGLGVLLGATGMGVMVMRNVLERRGELAILRAVGFSRSALRWLLVYEHGLILIAGSACGTIAALVAVAPTLRTSASDFPWVWIAVLVLGSVVNGLFWTVIAAMTSTRGDLLPALRDE
jgi:putative ABC transport system permease protein